MIQNMIKEGSIVPSEVTVKLIQKAMERSKTNKFLIDGFPRNEENRAAFERVVHLCARLLQSWCGGALAACDDDCGAFLCRRVSPPSSYYFLIARRMRWRSGCLGGIR